MPNLYLVDHDGISGMLDDGTEFVAIVTPNASLCKGCIAELDADLCCTMPKCWDFPTFPTHSNCIFKKKE